VKYLQHTTDLRSNPSICPYCQNKLSAATGLRETDQAPDEGALTVCLYCGELLIFNADLTLRKPTQEELIEEQRSSQWPLIERAMRGAKQLNFSKRNPRS